MCLAIPARIKQLKEDHLAVAEYNGNQMTVEMGLVAATVGDYVLIHAGCAVERIDRPWQPIFLKSWRSWDHEPGRPEGWSGRASQSPRSIRRGQGHTGKDQGTSPELDGGLRYAYGSHCPEWLTLPAAAADPAGIRPRLSSLRDSIRLHRPIM